MIVLNLLLNLFGASMLLLFAVRLVRTGIERSFGAQLRRLLSSESRGVSAALSGCTLAIMLQGATAVILMVSGLISAGVAQLSTGLAIAIGADVGSAIVIRVLTFEISWLVPLLMASGGWLYLKSKGAQWRNIGRACVGVALILVSLQMIGSAVLPVKHASLLPEVSLYLERDLVLAFIIGIAFTFLLHSSVASILVCVTLVGSQAMSLLVGMSFVLGANIGSALIPLWLTRGSEIDERYLPILNLAVRGFAASIAFSLLINFGSETLLKTYFSEANGVIMAHLAFNATLLIFLPFSKYLADSIQLIFPDQSDQSAGQGSARLISTLTAEKLDVSNPGSVLRRDVLSLLDSVSSMISECERLITIHDETAEHKILLLNDTVNETLHHIRTFYARCDNDLTSDTKQKEMRQLLEYAVRLKHSGNIMARRVLPVSKEMREEQLFFSDAGRAELEDLRCLALANTFLAFEVVSGWRSSSARELVSRKEELAKTEQRSRKRHFKRISASGNSVSLETSDLHLELSAAFKEINSKIATIAYVVLASDGQLADSRLLDESKVSG